MTKSANIEAIEKSTNTSWEEWLKYLDENNAKGLAHKDIAKQIYEKLQGTTENDGWWAQGIAVAYEQHIGRRQPGQNSDGSYEFSVSKTVTGTMSQALQAWVHLVGDRKEFAHISIAKPPTTSKTDKRHHWGCSLEDGSRISVDAYQKTPEKTSISITHTKLDSQEAVKRWQTYWKVLLETL